MTEMTEVSMQLKVSWFGTDPKISAFQYYRASSLPTFSDFNIILNGMEL